MTQDCLRTKWKFIVEFEDEETNEISGTIGQADTREECEGLLEFDMQYHDSLGRIVLNAEAAEVCAKCEGEGRIAEISGELGHLRCLWWAPWPDLKFEDSSTEPGGILTYQTRRFLRSTHAAACGLTTSDLLAQTQTHRRKEMNKGFSLTIRADDGSTMLQTNVDSIHQAFQRLIDWSIGALEQDIWAVISGPNEFCSKHRIKASQDFAWIEEARSSKEYATSIGFRR